MNQKPVGVYGAFFLDCLLRALSAAISRKRWLSGHLGYVEKLCTNVRGAFLVIRKAYADRYSFHARDEDGSPAIYLSRGAMIDDGEMH